MLPITKVREGHEGLGTIILPSLLKLYT